MIVVNQKIYKFEENNFQGQQPHLWSFETIVMKLIQNPKDWQKLQCLQNKILQ
jgi:hypothetical protein